MHGYSDDLATGETIVDPGKFLSELGFGSCASLRAAISKERTAMPSFGLQNSTIATEQKPTLRAMQEVVVYCVVLLRVSTAGFGVHPVQYVPGFQFIQSIPQVLYAYVFVCFIPGQHAR